MRVLDILSPFWDQMAPAWAMVKEHPFLTLGGVVLSSGAGANVLARILNKVPLGPWFKLLEGVGRTASRVGNLRFHKPLWEPFETWFLKALTGSVNALAAGLQSDNQAGGDSGPNVPPPGAA